MNFLKRNVFSFFTKQKKQSPNFENFPPPPHPPSRPLPTININLVSLPKNLCLLSENNNKIPVIFKKKMAVATNAYVFRFSLEDQNKVLGTMMGQHIKIHQIKERKDSNEKVEIVRNYNPISRIDDSGFVDILVKLIKDGPMSEFFQHLSTEEKVWLSGPYGTLSYNGFGSFSIKKKNGKEEKIDRNIKYLGLIVEGTGITGFFQIIEEIAMNKIDPTYLSILYVNKKIEDICFLEELTWFKEEGRLKIEFLVEEAPEYYNGLKGRLTKQMVEDFMPINGDDSLIGVCGRKEIKDEAIECLQNLGYSNDNIYLPS